MKSVIEFNDQQRIDFKCLARDVTCPTSIVYALVCIESFVEACSMQGLDESLIDEDVIERRDVCLAALEYFRMITATEEE